MSALGFSSLGTSSTEPTASGVQIEITQAFHRRTSTTTALTLPSSNRKAQQISIWLTHPVEALVEASATVVEVTEDEVIVVGAVVDQDVEVTSLRRRNGSQ